MAPFSSGFNVSGLTLNESSDSAFGCCLKMLLFDREELNS